MTKRARDLIVFVDRQSLTFAGGLLERPQKLIFDEQILLDLEIVDKKTFLEKILGIVGKTEEGTNLIMVFSDSSIFFKDIPLASSANEIEAQENDFLSLVPFDKVANKLIKLSDKYRLVAINWDVCSILSDSLEAIGYKLKMVIPAFIVSGFDQNAGLSETVASIVISKQDTYKIFSLGESSTQSPKVPMKSVVTSKRSNLPILVGVFVFLVVVFAVLLMSRI